MGLKLNDVAPLTGNVVEQATAAPDEHRVTAKEIIRVRRAECRTNGHSYREIEEMGFDGPVCVLCTNCGLVWTIAR